MNTGCQGPYKHGTGGWCGCNCGCCPPSCCDIISVYFSCGTDCGDSLPIRWQIKPGTTSNLRLPEFSSEPILSEDGRFGLGNGSIPCENVCIELNCGGVAPCCCLELLDDTIYAVGNGYVTAPSTVSISEDCGIGTVLINGQPPPVFVNDADSITVTVIPQQEGCQCYQKNIQCGPCPAGVRKPLFKRKIDPRTGKTRINPITGDAIIFIDKEELRRRILALKRRRKN